LGDIAVAGLAANPVPKLLHRPGHIISSIRPARLAFAVSEDYSTNSSNNNAGVHFSAELLAEIIELTGPCVTSYPSLDLPSAHARVVTDESLDLGDELMLHGKGQNYAKRGHRDKYHG
jgi:hypothetical protein